MNELKRKAYKILIISFGVFAVILFIAIPFLEYYGLIIFVIASFAFPIISLHKISCIKCPRCKQIYGVGVNLHSYLPRPNIPIRLVEVPSVCISCKQPPD